jgi:hypothetical protein
VAVFVGIALLAWLVLGGDDDEGSQANGPQAVSVEDLQEEAGSSQVPAFWAGLQAGTTYELTETSDGSVDVRYLPGDAEELANGGLALVDADRPSSVYLAYEGQPYQVEVYDPSPDRALELVTSGAVQPVR